jgi:hypothetical protein
MTGPAVICVRLRGLDPYLRDLIALYLAIKLGLVLTALIGHQALPFNWPLYRVNLVFDLQGLPEWLRTFNTWDTQHYLLLAQNGYGVDINPMSKAFFPLYPYLIWTFTPLFLNKGLIAAYAVANASSFLIPVYMYKLCCLFRTREQAFRATVLLLAFPTAFFLSSAYTEAIYLALCLMLFYYLFTGDTFKATVLSFLFPLVRAQALMFLIPVCVMFIQAAVGNLKTGVKPALPEAFRRFAPPAIALLLGISTYFVFCRLTLGGYFEGLRAQDLYVAKNSLTNIFMLNRWFLKNFVNISLELHGYTSSIIDRLTFLLCVPLLIRIHRTQNPALFAYAALALLVPALSGMFMSYTRFALVAFPIFIDLATRVRRPELIAVPMFALQILFFLLHTGGYWVA